MPRPVYQVPEQVFNAFYQYINSKPYAEVANLIGAINAQTVKIDLPDLSPPTPAVIAEPERD